MDVEMVLEVDQKSLEISNSLLFELEDLKAIYEKIELTQDEELSKILENNSTSSPNTVLLQS